MASANRIEVANSRVGLEPIAVFAFGVLSLVGWTLYAGPDFNWDLLNYHLYAGLHASGDTIARDYFPASSQSYLAPYGYWPLARMVAAKWPAMAVGSVLAGIHSLSVIATWYLSRQLIPGDSATAVTLRVVGTAIGVICPLVLTEVGTSFIDITSAIPIVLGIALLLKALDMSHARSRTFILSGLCFGLACVLKLSNAPFVLAAFLGLTILWGIRPDVSWKTLMVFGGAQVAGFAVGYGYWGFQLWQEFGNPFFPFFHSFFQPPILLSGSPASEAATNQQAFLSGIWDWFFSSTNRLQRFLPRNIWDWLLRPLYMIDPVANVYTEVRAPDARFFVLFCLAPFAVWKLRAQWRTSNLLPLLLIFLVGWILWMATSGNGRYLMPWALIVGPALVACANACWPRRDTLPLIATTAFVFVQTALLADGTQFRWAGSPWQEYWISAKLPREVTDHPVTFVTFDGQSASWLSAFAHPESRFANPGGPPLRPVAGKGADRFSWVLQQSPEIIAIFKFDYFEPGEEIPFPLSPANREVTALRMGLEVDFGSCVTGNLIEAGPKRIGAFWKDGVRIERTAVQGFFFCRAVYKPELKRQAPLDPVREAAFKNIEDACPRQFPRGGAQTICAANTCWRTYSTADTDLIIAADGDVTSRFYGAFQQPYLGNVVELSRDASKVACQEELGRYAPWSPGENLLVKPPIPNR